MPPTRNRFLMIQLSHAARGCQQREAGMSRAIGRAGRAACIREILHAGATNAARRRQRIHRGGHRLTPCHRGMVAGSPRAQTAAQLTALGWRMRFCLKKTQAVRPKSCTKIRPPKRGNAIKRLQNAALRQREILYQILYQLSAKHARTGHKLAQAAWIDIRAGLMQRP